MKLEEIAASAHHRVAELRSRLELEAAKNADLEQKFRAEEDANHCKLSRSKFQDENVFAVVFQAQKQRNYYPQWRHLRRGRHCVVNYEFLQESENNVFGFFRFNVALELAQAELKDTQEQLRSLQASIPARDQEIEALKAQIEEKTKQLESTINGEQYVGQLQELVERYKLENVQLTQQLEVRRPISRDEIYTQRLYFSVHKVRLERNRLEFGETRRRDEEPGESGSG